MKDKIIKEYKAIDDYYEKREMNQDDFSSKLQYTLDKMDKLNSIDDEYKVEVNLLNIIETAENKKKAKREKREFIMFIATSFMILLAIALITIFNSISIIIYAQVIIAISLPLCLIPIGVMAWSRGGKNE